MNVRRWYEDADRFVIEHTKISWLIWALAVAVLVPSFGAAAPLHEPSRYGWMSWLTVYMIVSTPVAVLSLRRARDRVPDRHIPIVIFGWLIAQIPLLCAMAALFDHAPQWFGAVGFFEAILLMNYATRSERRARSQLSP